MMQEAVFSPDRFLSDRIQRLQESPTIAVTTRAKTMQAQGIDVIPLAGGDPDFDTPAHIVEAGLRALKDGGPMHHYGLARGLPALRQALAARYEADYGLRYDPNTQILTTPGGKQGIMYALLATVNPGDEVLIPDPYWPSHAALVELAGGDVAPVPCSPADDFRVTAAAIEAAITPRSKALLLTNPHNPTGALLSRAELDAIAQVVERHNLLVIADEIYEKLVYDGLSFTSFAALDGMQERTIISNGFSKAYAMTGWRLGYLVGPSWWVNEAAKLQTQSVTCVAPFIQQAAVAALTGPQDAVAAMVASYQSRRDFVVEKFNSTGVLHTSKPQGAFYVFVDISALGMESTEAATLFLDKAHVACTPGIAFGAQGEGFLRFTYAIATERLGEAVERIVAAVQ